MLRRQKPLMQLTMGLLRAYFATKPEKLLNGVKKGLKKQDDAKMFSEQQIAEFIETRVRQLSTP